MATEIIGTFRRWSATVDKDGYREYKIVFLVKCASADEGPAEALNTSGLPTFGSAWDFYDDFDPWAFRQHDVTVTPIRSKDSDVILHFELEFLYSTKPFRDCAEAVEDPLTKPQTVGGGLTHLKEEGVNDRFGKPILNSSLERIHSTNNEWDKSLPSIEIEQNVAVLDLTLCEGMLDRVNAYPLWGMPKRCVKCSMFVWEKKYYGTCFPYYTRKFQFDINSQSFDRNLLDEGTKVLNGKWNFSTREWELTNIPPVGGDPPNRYDPTHFIRFKDPNAENMRTLLDNGVPYKPLARITTCAQCPGPVGTFRKWRVSGLDRDVSVTYDSGCTWLDAVDAQEPTLTYESIGATWQFELDDDLLTPGGIWATDGADWNCVGSNLMYKVSGTHPASVVLLSEYGPGKIRVEKYDEADFLLLGIPTTF